MRCNGLPNAYEPSDLRKYMHMWQLETQKANAADKNWLLNVNERTVLTQNLKAPNATRIHLQQQQSVLGDSYAMRIINVLGVGAVMADSNANTSKYWLNLVFS